MDETLEKKILDILDQHRIMTVATNRPDGWPQATTVGYVNDGLTIYFLCSPQSQKAANLARDNRISLTIDHDVSDPMAITGLSMAAHAQPVNDPTEVARAMSLLGIGRVGKSGVGLSGRISLFFLNWDQTAQGGAATTKQAIRAARR